MQLWSPSVDLRLRGHQASRRFHITLSVLVGTRVAVQIMSKMIYFRLGELKK